MIKWLKSLSWIAIAGAIGAFAMALLRANKAGKLEALNERDDAEVAELEKGTAEQIEKAATLQKRIKDRNTKLSDIKQKAEAGVIKANTSNETMADIAKRFNGRSVRKPTRKAT